MNKQQFKFLVNALSTNEARRNLMFLEFNVAAFNCTITSANAYLIKQIKITCDLPDGKYYFELKQVKKLLKIANNTDIINLTLDGIEVDGVILKWGKDEFSYPDLSNLINGNYGPTNKVLGFNSVYMTDALKACPEKVFKMEFKRTDTHSCSLESPCRITFNENPDYTSFILPVIIKW